MKRTIEKKWDREQAIHAAGQSGSINGKGYICVYAPWHPRARKKGQVLKHIVIAELAFGGPLPGGLVVHHADGNRTNNANSNLVICENADYHRLIHYRLKILQVGGNPTTDRVCRDCLTPKNKSEFYFVRSINSHRSFCRPCDSKRKRHYKYRPQPASTVEVLP